MVEEDINCEADRDHTDDDDGDGNDGGDKISSKTITTKTKYINWQFQLWIIMFRRVCCIQKIIVTQMFLESIKNIHSLDIRR